MKTILCYGDSNTWGSPPAGLARHAWGVRWPGILQKRHKLLAKGIFGEVKAIFK